MSVALAYSLKDDGIVVLPELTADLGNGLTGYYQQEPNAGCLRAALATALQEPYEDIHLASDRWPEALFVFAFGRGMEAERRHLVDGPPELLWVIATPPLPEVGGDRHVLVGKGSEVCFDTWGWRRADGSPYPDNPPRIEPDHGYVLRKEPHHGNR